MIDVCAQTKVSTDANVKYKPMAKILITGGAGYVGAHAAKALAKAGHEIVVYDSLIHGQREFVRWGPLIVGDVRDASALTAAFASHRFDAVMHFAALAYVGELVKDPNVYYDTNVHGTRTLLHAMREAEVRRIVFSSTCAVYGEPTISLIGEQTPLGPINPYGFSKMVCERMMDDFDAAYGLKSVRLRYFNAGGADPEGEIGESHTPETHLIPLAILAAMGRVPVLRVFGDNYPTPDGTAIRDYIHVNDLADAHVMALNHLLDCGETLIVNLGAGRGVSVGEVIAGVERISQKKVPIEMAPRRPGDPAHLVADPGQARVRLGWTAGRSNLDNLLKDAWAWHDKLASKELEVGLQR